MLDKNTLAPNFKLLDQDGKEHSLLDYRGSYVLVYFYPKDDPTNHGTEILKDIYEIKNS